MRKLSKLMESVWGDIRKKSLGKEARVEDDINLFSRDEFFEYLNENYKYIGSNDPFLYGPKKATRTESISVPC